MAESVPYYAKKLIEFEKKYLAENVCEELTTWMHNKKIMDLPVRIYRGNIGGTCDMNSYSVERSGNAMLSFWNREMAEDFLRDMSTLKSLTRIRSHYINKNDIFKHEFEIQIVKWTGNTAMLMEIILESGEDPIKALEEIKYKLQAKKLGLL